MYFCGETSTWNIMESNAHTYEITRPDHGNNVLCLVRIKVNRMVNYQVYRGKQ